MVITRQEQIFIKQLIALRERKEEKLQAQWRTLVEEQNNCRKERQLAYLLWSVSRAVLVELKLDDILLTRNELTQLVSDKRSQYEQERARAESIDYWDKRVAQIEHQKAELTRQKTVLIRGKEKLKRFLYDQ